MNNFHKRLSRFVLLFVSVFVYLTQGRSDKKPKKKSTIVVVLTGKLGDIVCGTPVLLAIRKNLPRTRIIVGGATKLQRAVLSESGLVDEYLDLESKGALLRIKKVHADVAVVTGPSYLATVLLYVARIPLVVAPSVVGGFSPSETRPYKILKRFIKTYPYEIGKYAPLERLSALRSLGIISVDTKKHLAFSQEAEKRAQKFFVDQGILVGKDFIVAISPSAGNKIKEWPEEKFAEVVDHLASKHQAKVIIIGGPNDREKVNRTLEHLKVIKNCVSVTDFNVDELKAFISKINLFISVDTGPIYIAEAFGIPTVDITGPIDENEQPPIGPRNKVVVPQGDRKPELFVLNAKSYNYDEAIRQVNSISAAQVIGTVDSLVKELKNEISTK